MPPTRPKSAARPLFPPRNARAADVARSRGVPLVASFVGDDVAYRNPTMYCDAGRRYDWTCVAGLEVVLLVRPGVDFRHAGAALLEVLDVIHGSYPVAVDVERQTVAAIVHGTAPGSINLWPYRKGCEQWLNFFR